MLHLCSHSAAVNASHNFYQHKNRRSTEYLFNALDDSIRILQDFYLIGEHQAHCLFPVHKTKKGIVTVKQNA